MLHYSMNVSRKFTLTLKERGPFLKHLRGHTSDVW